jgi:hypothetical protein
VTTLDEALGWRGQNLLDAEGQRIGTIEEVYLDADTNAPEWALVHTGRLGTGRAFVPLRDAKPTEDGPAVPFEKSVVKDAPAMDPDGQLTKREEAELYRHYGMDASLSGLQRHAELAAEPDAEPEEASEAVTSAKREAG